MQSHFRSILLDARKADPDRDYGLLEPEVQGTAKKTDLFPGTTRVVLDAQIRPRATEGIFVGQQVRRVSKRHLLVAEGCDWVLDLLRKTNQPCNIAHHLVRMDRAEEQGN